MRKFIKKIAFVSFVFMLMFNLEAHGQELLQNNGFENWTGSNPDYWTNSGYGGWGQAFDSLTQNTSDVHGGSSSVQLQWNDSPAKNPWFWQKVNVSSGTFYKLVVWIKSISGTPSVNVKITWYDSSDTYLGNSGTWHDNVPSTWTAYTQTGTAPANASYALVGVVGSKNSGASGTILVDDASFQESEITTYTYTYTNGSFEVWSEGLPVRWSNQTCHGWGEAFDSVQQSSDAKHGSYSVQLTWNTGHTYNPIFYQEISVTGGQDYTFSFYAKAVSGTPDIEAKITFYDSAWGLLSYQYSDWTTITSSWNQLSVSATAPANAAYATVAIVGGKTSTGTIVVDEARLNGNLEGGGGSEGGETTTGGETGTSPSVSAASGELSVELSREAFSPYLGQSSQIVFQLGGAQSITYSIRIFDIKGNPVKDLVVSKELSDSSNQNQNDVWDGTDNLSSVLPPGNYIILVVVKDNVSGKIYTAKKRIVITF